MIITELLVYFKILDKYAALYILLFVTQVHPCASGNS